MRGCYHIHKLIRYLIARRKLAPEQMQQLEVHLTQCSRCRLRYEQYQQLHQLLERYFEPHQLRKDVVAEALAHIRSGAVECRFPIKEPVKGWWRSYRPVWVTAVAIFIIASLLFVARYYVSYSQQIVVKNVHGQGVVYLPKGSTQWQLIQVGQRVAVGSQLVTNQWSQVECRSGLGIRFWLNRDTRIQVSTDTAYILSIQYGELYVQKTGRSRFQIKTPAGMIDPVGTSYDIQVDKSGNTQVAVVLGKVRLTNAVGSVTISEHYLSTAEYSQHKAPSLPVVTDINVITQWVNNFKEITKYPTPMRSKLAEQAIEQGLRYFNEKQMYAASTTFLWAVELMPESPRGYYYLGRTYRALAQFAKSTTVFVNVLKLAPNYSDTHFQLGKSFYDLYQFDQAKKEMEQMVQQDPTNHEYLIWLGVIDIKMHDLADGEQWIRSGLALSPCEICAGLAYYGLGLSAFERKEFQEAIRYAQLATQISPEASTGYWLLSRVYYAMRDIEKGAEYEKRARQIEEQLRQAIK